MGTSASGLLLILICLIGNPGCSSDLAGIACCLSDAVILQERHLGLTNPELTLVRQIFLFNHQAAVTDLPADLCSLWEPGVPDRAAGASRELGGLQGGRQRAARVRTEAAEGVSVGVDPHRRSGARSPSWYWPGRMSWVAGAEDLWLEEEEARSRDAPSWAVLLCPSSRGRVGGCFCRITSADVTLRVSPGSLGINGKAAC